MLKLGDKWVTSKHKYHIYRARREGPMRAYCKSQYGWTDKEFDGVYWQSVRRVRQKMSFPQFRQSCKMMHGWLPTMHMRHHVTGINQRPGCTCCDETIYLMFHCPHQLMKAKRRDIIAQLRKKGLKARIPRRVISTVIAVLRKYFDQDDDLRFPTLHPSLRLAISQQLDIGLNFLPRGFLATGWYDAIAATGVSYPERKMDALQRPLWNTILEPIWHQCNDLLRSKQSKYPDVESERLAERIQWYVEHKHDVLSIHDHHLARFDVPTIHRMSRDQRREWIRHLDAARAAYANELNQRASKQNVITHYLSVRSDVTETSP